jgi:hypothetical protein
MDIPTLESQLDIMVNDASQTGMYITIDNHSSDDPVNWNKNTVFWTATGPRYSEQYQREL